MIENTIFENEPATVCWLTNKFEPCSREGADLVKVVTPTRVIFAVPNPDKSKPATCQHCGQELPKPAA